MSSVDEGTSLENGFDGHACAPSGIVTARGGPVTGLLGVGPLKSLLALLAGGLVVGMGASVETLPLPCPLLWRR